MRAVFFVNLSLTIHHNHPGHEPVLEYRFRFNHKIKCCDKDIYIQMPHFQVVDSKGMGVYFHTPRVLLQLFWALLVQIRVLGIGADVGATWRDVESEMYGVQLVNHSS